LIVHIESLQSNQCNIASKTIHVSCEENMGAYGSKVRESWKVSDPRRLASLLIPSWGECHRPCFLAVVPFASSPFFSPPRPRPFFLLLSRYIPLLISSKSSISKESS
jgi:hypothetical protein